MANLLMAGPGLYWNGLPRGISTKGSPLQLLKKGQVPWEQSGADEVVSRRCVSGMKKLLVRRKATSTTFRTEPNNVLQLFSRGMARGNGGPSGSDLVDTPVSFRLSAVYLLSEFSFF